jgi:hypothetical protein
VCASRPPPVQVPRQHIRLYWVSPFIVCEDCTIDHVQHECAWGRTPFQLHIVAIFIQDAHPPELSTTQVFVGSILAPGRQRSSPQAIP